MRQLLTAILVLGIASSALADDNAKEADFNFKSKKALAAIKNFQATGENIDESHEKEHKKNRLDLILALEEALQAERTEGDLDEAITIRDAIKALKKGATPPGVVAGEKNVRIPRDAVKWKGHHYKAFDVAVPWTVAVRRCEEMGGHLVWIQSASESNFVRELIQRERFRFHWIDGSDAEEEGDWRSHTGAQLRFTNWRSGEPNSVNKSEHWIVIGKSGFWADVFAGLRDYGFICEWDQ